jgi:hypothetical protein
LLSNSSTSPGRGTCSVPLTHRPPIGPLETARCSRWYEDLFANVTCIIVKKYTAHCHLDVFCKHRELLVSVFVTNKFLKADLLGSFQNKNYNLVVGRNTFCFGIKFLKYQTPFELTLYLGLKMNNQWTVYSSCKKFCKKMIFVISFVSL